MKRMAIWLINNVCAMTPLIAILHVHRWGPGVVRGSYLLSRTEALSVAGWWCKPRVLSRNFPWPWGVAGLKAIIPPHQQPSNKDVYEESPLLLWAQWDQNHTLILPLPCKASPHSLPGVFPRHSSLALNTNLHLISAENPTWDLPASWSKRKYSTGKKNSLFRGTLCFQNICIWHSVFS